MAWRMHSIAPTGLRAYLRPMLAFLLLAGFAAFGEPTVGPANGTLFVHGGGKFTKDQVAEFIKLAGGIDAPFVIIPTAYPGEDWSDSYITESFLRRAGAKNVKVLHTRDREVANSPTFVEPLLTARGVWIDGGRQWRLADAYLGTRVMVELHKVLERGGVIGGSSAGATIQGSYMVRGSPEGNHIMMAAGHEEGFAFLRNTAVDQHVIARKREKDLLEVVAAKPGLLGIGLDEGTAIVVQQDRARVLGASKVLLYFRELTPANPLEPYLSFKAGEVIDLALKKAVSGQ